MMEILNDLGRQLGEHFFEAQERQVREMLKEVFAMESIDLNPDDPAQYNEIGFFMENNGKYEFHTIEQNELRTDIIILETGTDRFVIGRSVRIVFDSVGVKIQIGALKPTDPFAAGKEVRAFVGTVDNGQEQTIIN